jgi:hypothetical protein
MEPPTHLLNARQSFFKPANPQQERLLQPKTPKQFLLVVESLRTLHHT